MKKTIVLLTVLMLAFAGLALASEAKVNGKVTAVAGDVVGAAEVVEDRAADAGRGVRAEREAARPVEALDGVDQAHAARADEIAQLDLHAQRTQDLTGNVVHEGQVSRQDLVPRALVSALLVGIPEHRRFHWPRLSSK
jgi:hypothetical protein